MRLLIVGVAEIRVKLRIRRIELDCVTYRLNRTGVLTLPGLRHTGEMPGIGIVRIDRQSPFGEMLRPLKLFGRETSGTLCQQLVSCVITGRRTRPARGSPPIAPRSPHAASGI